MSTLKCLYMTNTRNRLTGWGPIVDGDFIERFGSIQLAEGAFLKVPIVDGTNSDEGISFGRTGINTTDQFVAGIVSKYINLSIYPHTLYTNRYRRWHHLPRPGTSYASSSTAG